MVGLFVLSLALTPAEARADWPHGTQVYTASGDLQAFGTGLRNWGPTDDVFVAVEVADEVNAALYAFDVSTDLYRYECSDNDGCATVTLQNTLGVGSSIYDQLTQTSLAIRKKTAQPVEVLAVLRQKIEDDCDGDSVTYLADPSDEVANLDLGARLFSTTAGEIRSWEVRANDPVTGDCFDQGVSYARFGPAPDRTPTACFSSEFPSAYAPWYYDRVACNDADGAGTTPGSVWSNYEYMHTASYVAEDHPSFDFYSSNGERAVSGTHRSATQAIRVHFPDETAPPSEPIVSFPATDEKVDFSDVLDHAGKLHMVWADDHLDYANSTVRYQVCDYSSTVDCTDASEWLTTDEIVADSTSGYNDKARGVAVAMDGDRQFVVWSHDASGVGTDKWRVVVASRCVGGSWGYEEVRSSAGVLKDQFTLNGRPSIVLNRGENIAHVAFIEAEKFGGSYGDIASNENGTAWWYRDSYVDCP